jgi:hypothetical protein
MAGGPPRRMSTAPFQAQKVIDRGVSLVEILVAIVLLGTVVIATLVALRTTVIGTRVERDHSKAYQWLQSATSVLQGLPPIQRRDCTDPDLTLHYQTIVGGLAPPFGWEVDGQLEIRDPILFESEDGDGFGTLCAASSNLSLQLITIVVRNPTGDIIEELEVIVDGI